MAAAQVTSGSAAHEPPTYLLRLYLTGTRRRSVRAMENVRRLCEKHLNGSYELEVIDLYQQPMLASREQIVCSPTLVKRQPLPIRRVVGDMSDTQRVLGGLGIAGSEA